MNERQNPEDPEVPAADEAPGWQVLDADGNVVQSGPGVTLAAVSDAGEEEEQQ